ncbi:Dbl homology domain-containing protein [Backusella circina FSU 941]|nr:Dbl homology domain-containing protein [Backusella circina FSU 941]
MNHLHKQCSILTNRPSSTASFASDPVLPYTLSSSLPPANMQRSLSDRLKRRLTPEGSQLKSKLISYKEKEGIAIWKKTHQEYISNANMIPLSGHSTHLTHFIVNELLSTEITYLKHLMILKQMLMDPLLQAANSYPRPSVNLKDIQTIFLYIPELITLSSLLVHRLKDTIRTTENGETHGSIGEVFCELEEHFDIYISYAANFSKQQRCIARADRSIVYRQLVQDSLRKKETNRMGLSDYMISPIQRITRYGLLLKGWFFFFLE